MEAVRKGSVAGMKIVGYSLPKDRYVCQNKEGMGMKKSQRHTRKMTSTGSHSLKL